MEMHGQNEIGFAWSAQGQRVSRATNPLTGEALPGEFREATPEEIARACAKARRKKCSSAFTAAAQAPRVRPARGSVSRSPAS